MDTAYVREVSPSPKKLPYKIQDSCKFLVQIKLLVIGVSNPKNPGFLLKQE